MQIKQVNHLAPCLLHRSTQCLVVVIIFKTFSKLNTKFISVFLILNLFVLFAFVSSLFQCTFS